MEPHEFVRAFTLPLVHLEKRSTYGVGSAILLQLNRRHYLITAAHVDIESRSLVALTGNSADSSPLGNLCRFDDIDITVVEVLNASAFESFGLYRFLPEEYHSTNHILDLSSGSLPYLVVGYPSGRTKKEWNSEMVKSLPWALFTTPLEYNDPLYGPFQPPMQFLVRFNRKKVLNINNGQLQFPPKLEGIVSFPEVRPMITGGEAFLGPAGPRNAWAGQGLHSTDRSHEKEQVHRTSGHRHAQAA